MTASEAVRAVLATLCVCACVMAGAFVESLDWGSWLLEVLGV